MDLSAIREDAKNWTLASDQKLLDLLQNFSKNIDTKATDCVKNVDSLFFQVTESEVALRNVFNEFLMLGNSQFIENRVYDDDDDDGEEEDKSSSDIPPVPDPLILMREAFQSGQQALKLYYYDDTHANKEEDIYNIRALPYIIGTQMFNESPDAGLGFAVELEDDDEGEDEVHQGEQSDAQLENEDHEEQPLNSNEADEPISQPVYNAIPSTSYSNTDEETSRNHLPPAAPPLPPPRPALSLSDAISSQIHKRRTQEDTEEDEDDDADNTSEWADSKPGDRDQPALDNNAKTSIPAIRPIIPLPPKAPTVADTIHSDSRKASDPPQLKGEPEEEEEEEDDLFAASDDPYSFFSSNRKSVGVKKSISSKTRDSLSDLFGNTEEDSSPSKNRPASTSRASFTALFGEISDSSLFDDVPSKPNEKQTSEKSDSISSSTKAKDDSASSLFDEKPSSSSVQESKPIGKQEPKTNRFSSLFGDDSNDTDIFSGKKETTPVVPVKRGSSLFGDEDGDLFGTSAPKDASKQSSSKKSIFDADDSMDPFGAAPPIIKPKSEPAPAPAPVAKKSMFDDDSSDPFGAAPPIPIKPKSEPAPAPVAKKSMFDDDSSDPFGAAPPIPIKPKSEPAPAPVPVAKKSVFDDDSSDPFGAAPPIPIKPKSEPAPAPAPVAKKSVFDDDSSDPFGAAPPIPIKPKSEPAPAPAPAPVAKKSVFDDDSSDPFGAAPPLPIKPKSEPAPAPVPVAKKSVFDAEESSVASTIEEKRPPGRIGQLAAGIKIILPGAPPPMRSDRSANENDAPSEFVPTNSVLNEEKSFESVTSANLNRATVAGKTRRAPARKAFAEESDLFADPTQHHTEKQESKSVVQNSSQHAENPKPAENIRPASLAAIPKPSNARSLFEESDSSDSEDEVQKKPISMSSLLNTAPIAAPAPAPAPAPPTPAISEPLIQKPLGSTENSLFGDEDVKPLSAKTEPPKKQNLFAEDPLISNAVESAEKASPVPTMKPTVAKSSSLFGDDDDDDFFGKSKEKKLNSQPVAKKSSLFGDDDDDIFGNKSTTTTTTKKKGLFDD